ncbi:threonine-phosphate decarboxylase CobD [Leptolyngbya sp. PCC 6406]|uniref:threonine-phosphate decarboxylase CobD n=1 Tax=Leptolyngbya sp. PCC 6406 TaxID=1173264 RepID=UPI0002ABE5D2|nr:threonine-phosphate decarboxylase CobD [Leptolyngbya sp. PCC 6406]
MAHPSRNTRPTHGGNVAWAAQIANCSPHGLLDFSASVSPLGPPPSVLAAIQAGIAALSRYPNPTYGALRQALGAHHGIDPDWVVPGNGAAELLTWIGRDLAALDATALITPAFADYSRSLRAFGGRPHPCPLPLEQAIAGMVDWQAVLQHSLPLQRSPQAWGLLVNTPHNPTGLLIPADVIASWLDQFALVVVDEAFMDFLPPEQQQSVISLVADHSNLVVLRSLTKFYSLPGLRLGYAIAQPERLQRWQQWRDPWPVNTLAEIAAIAALQDSDYQQATWRWLPPARAALATGLQAIPGFLPCPSVANYLLVRCDGQGSAQSGDGISGPDLQHRLLVNHHILIRDCLSFPELRDRYFRIAVRTPEENGRLLVALREVMGWRGVRVEGCEGDGVMG